MSNKKESIIDEGTLNILKEVKSHDQSSDEVKEALKAIEKTGQIMETIMAGRKIDLAFYRLFTANAIKKLKKIKSNKQ